MMFGRATRTLLPTATNSATDKKYMREAENKKKRRQKVVKQNHDKAAKDLPTIKIKQSVFFKHHNGGRWQKGICIDRVGKRSYMIEGVNGGLYRRNRVHIRPTKIMFDLPEMCAGDVGGFAILKGGGSEGGQPGSPQS